ncbi:uncharacterized protein LOC102623973 isoform X2 [Citrus sinensis]|uniref:uncharacterized protein LOC102623973 isoform X2 n=1 Tax=Citrus sinensis TaxID=2711 RepID=UPI002277E06B|nr:uncharacterized protein LOC102623973 isoform X2 [Citrus sinensis]
MPIYVATPALLNRISINFAYLNSGKNHKTLIKKTSRNCCCSIAASASGLFAAAVVIAAAASDGIGTPQDQAETLSNIPQELSGDCASGNDCRKPRIQRPKSRKAESCTIKCVTTCIRGGDGSPGEGPLNVRRPIVVFKEGFRSRRYCKRSNTNCA